jgi:pimeloyl-ACP methyl ester carboxylesterase
VTLSWARFAVCSAASFIAGTLTWSIVQSEGRIRPYLRSEAEAAYPDSKFVSAGAVTAHYLEALPSSGQPALTLLCLHGFGASCASYRLVLQPLADSLQARVLSVDMPGFGLTNRPARVKDFCPQQMVSGLVQSLGLSEKESNIPLVIMGHSLGGLVAAKHLISADSAVAAAVLVAPLVVHSGGHAKSGCADLAPEATGVQRMFVVSIKAMAGAAGAFIKYGIQGLVRLLMPVLALGLRRMVYTPDFWPQALGATYHDRSNLRAEIVAGYRRASWVKGWDRSLLNFVRFRMTAGKTLYEMLQHAFRASLGSASSPSTPKALQDTGKPLLFIHGEGDKVIPSANSRFVSGMLTGQAEYVEVAECGHCPMEEQPATFVTAVTSYLKGVLPPTVWRL